MEQTTTSLRFDNDILDWLYDLKSKEEKKRRMSVGLGFIINRELREHIECKTEREVGK
jgi:hypothetical protein